MVLCVHSITEKEVTITNKKPINIPLHCRSLIKRIINKINGKNKCLDSTICCFWINLQIYSCPLLADWDSHWDRIAVGNGFLHYYVDVLWSLISELHEIDTDVNII